MLVSLSHLTKCLKLTCDLGTCSASFFMVLGLEMDLSKMSFSGSRWWWSNFDVSLKVYTLSVSGDRLIVGTAGRRVLVWDLRNMGYVQQRRESSLKYQTRCIRAFPNKQVPTPPHPSSPLLTPTCLEFQSNDFKFAFRSAFYNLLKTTVFACVCVLYTLLQTTVNCGNKLIPHFREDVDVPEVKCFW